MISGRKICILTGTRAEYGILSSLMKELKNHPDVTLQIIAMNMHLSPEYGLTYKEIEADGFVIDKKVEMLLSSDTAVGTVKSMGLALIGLSDALSELSPDIVVILGDRYEMLAAASAASILGIPIAHLHGGEITEGAYDDFIRHAISKMAYLHFTSTEEYRKRVIQMGESPERVFYVGALGVDNIKKETLLSLSELEESLGRSLGDKFLIVTYHPVTMEAGNASEQIAAMLSALDTVLNNYKLLITLPNSDADGRLIAAAIKEWATDKEDKVIVVQSLGRKRFYTAMKYSTAIIGNSSSGIIEAPTFGIPTLNVGNRQKGRAQGNTIINCTPDRNSILEGLGTVLSKDFIDFVGKQGNNPYYRPDTLRDIVNILTTYKIEKYSSKSFFDIRFEI
ncbi:MAG: UDP-N-acetylglucosamine 2-epimerase (hydrolyzing) [Bacteroidales bacterium]|nr:UDP-N-acetylglucosamine 2-epimerase (hydrolyzing) [Bacteroidales bacterium]